MKRLSMAFALLMLASPLPCFAEMAAGEHRSGGLGFHNVEAPVGFRWWLGGQKIGIDLGFGFTSTPEGTAYPDEQLTAWAIDGGVPFVIHSWHAAHVLLRPGVSYQSQQVTVTAPPVAFDTDDETTLRLGLELEGEVFLADNFSVSASHGVAFQTFEPAGGGDSQSSFNTIGRNFTTVGFHIYFLGGTY